MRPVDPGLQDEEADGHLSLQSVRGPDHRTLRDVVMLGQDFLDRPRGKPMARHVDDVVGPRHHVQVAVLVQVAGVGRLVVAGEGR